MMPHVELFKIQFSREANAIAALYGAPVFLVGGALKMENPRDWDVRVRVFPWDEKRLFGGEIADVPKEMPLDQLWTPQQWARAHENLKQSRNLSAQFGRRIDFQIQTAQEALPYREYDRVRLDQAPDTLFNAGFHVGFSNS